MSYEFNPKWKPGPPGDTIRGLMEEQDISIGQLGKLLDMTGEDTEALVRGELVLSSEIADKLEAVFKAPARFWVNREKLYREGWDALG